MDRYILPLNRGSYFIIIHDLFCCFTGLALQTGTGG